MTVTKCSKSTSGLFYGVIINDRRFLWYKNHNYLRTAHSPCLGLSSELNMPQTYYTSTLEFMSLAKYYNYTSASVMCITNKKQLQ